MRPRPLRLAALAAGLAAGAWAQTPPGAELAGMRQDILLLNQRLGELNMTVEQLARDNAALKAHEGESYATLEQLNRAVAEINRTLQAGLAEQKRDILADVAVQLERLAKQTQAAIDAVARNEATRPPVAATFSDDFPKQGVNYTVQNGDTLAVIARKNNARMQDIINANKIADPSKIRAGQTLFIPQAPAAAGK